MDSSSFLVGPLSLPNSLADPPRQTPPSRQTWGMGQTPRVQIPLVRPAVGRPGGLGRPFLGKPFRSRPPSMQTLLWMQTPPPTRGYINKHVVRILLECILVKFYLLKKNFSFYKYFNIS